MVATNLIKVEARAGGLSGRTRGRPGAARPADSTENGWISFWRAWTVNYGRYCPPANNRPPHYMWKLLTADRLGGSLSAATWEPSSKPPLYPYSSPSAPTFDPTRACNVNLQRVSSLSFIFIFIFFPFFIPIAPRNVPDFPYVLLALGCFSLGDSTVYKGSPERIWPIPSYWRCSWLGYIPREGVCFTRKRLCHTQGFN